MSGARRPGGQRAAVQSASAPLAGSERCRGGPVSGGESEHL